MLPMTVSTTTTSKTGGASKKGRSKSRDAKKQLDWSLISEVVEMSDAYAQKWTTVTARLECNVLELYKGKTTPQRGDKPKVRPLLRAGLT